MRKLVTNETFYRWVMLLIALATLLVGIAQAI